MTEERKRQILATAVRNASTHQCIFSGPDEQEYAYLDGMLHRVTPNTSQYQRGYMPIALRVEELPGMPDDEIWARVMGN